MKIDGQAIRQWGRQLFPIVSWLPRYRAHTLGHDSLAALIVTLMLIPQALAYALLAGVPAVIGLYASLLPLAVYTLFGSSTTLSVGPMAVVSLMTATAAAQVAGPGSEAYLPVVISLAALSGVILTIMGLCRLGFLANFLSHPVIAGFISASALIIAASQLPSLLGLPDAEGSPVQRLMALSGHPDTVNLPTLVLGISAALVMWLGKHYLAHGLSRLGCSLGLARFVVRMVPIMTIAVTTTITWVGGLSAEGVQVVGSVTSGLPSLIWPDMSVGRWQQLGVSALLISVVGFVESMSVAQALATRRRERLDPNQELVGLGMANMGAAVCGSFPVAGSLSRSAVNHDAGAATPAAGLFAAGGVALASVTLTPVIAHLPTAVLAAVIIVSVMSLLDWATLVRAWRYSRGDAAAMLATFFMTLWQGVETGLVTGAALSLTLYLYRTSRPHCAILGRVPGTEHFRNIDRFDEAETDQEVLILRIDESLYFANARFLEETIDTLCVRFSGLRHLVLACQAINLIDASALDSLEEINARLKEAGIAFHLAEVKGPVMDRLRDTQLLSALGGQVHLSVYHAWDELHGTGQEHGAIKVSEHAQTGW